MDSGRIMSKTVKRRLRRERLEKEKAGDFIAFKPSPNLEALSAAPTTENLPKLTKSAKRAARKRKKMNKLQQEMNSICSKSDNVKSTAVLKEQKEKNNLPSPKKRKNKRSKTAKPSAEEEVKEQEYVPSPKKSKMSNGTSDKTGEDSKISLSSDKNSSANTTTDDVVKGSINGNDDDDDESETSGNDLAKEGGIENPEEAAKMPKQDLPPKKRRYVLFVGNLAYETQEADIMDHFKRVGPVTSVRLAKHKDTNAPRGFCHLEVGDEETYLKALSLHHTFLHKRRINVEYSSGQSGEKGDTKRKTFKLHTLSKTGQLGGATKQKKGHAKKLGKESVQEAKKAFFV